MLEAQNLSRRIGERQLFAAVSFTLNKGKRQALHGPSGCGKTTLLRILAGFEAPDEGQVWIDGALASSPDGVTIPPHRRGIALAFQTPALWPHLTVLENLTFVAPGRELAARDLLARLGLGDGAAKHPGALSGGEQKRVELARALLAERPVLLLDEPFAHLDPTRRGEVARVIGEHLAPGRMALLVVTHDEREADLLACEARLDLHFPLDPIV